MAFFDPTQMGAVPVPDPGAPMPDTGGATTPNMGTTSDVVREMIRMADLYIQLETDDIGISEMRAIQAKLQSRLAKEQKEAQKPVDPMRLLIEQTAARMQP